MTAPTTFPDSGMMGGFAKQNDPTGSIMLDVAGVSFRKTRFWKVGALGGPGGGGPGIIKTERS